MYSFAAGTSDGGQPRAGVIYVGGTLYGTTVAGGSYSCPNGPYNGCGTVFSVTPSGAEKVLHSFGAGSDGRLPQAGLVDVRSTLYGTTSGGGTDYCSSCGLGGTVFSITPNGTEKVLHSFNGYSDGSNPYGRLINVKGTLYGTTFGGGGGSGCGYSSTGCGLAFSITTAGIERVLHNFGGDRDGAYPQAGLIDVKGTLYGTTSEGGTHDWGTVFSLTPSGQEKVLHSFGSGTDGGLPLAGLIEVNGTLYGTTQDGGANGCGYHRYGCGTVFSITPGGKEKVLHSFDGADGSGPGASLIDVNGKLYGTTEAGGAYSCGSQGKGCGTVFSITPKGTEKVLHSFGASPDGWYPYTAGLIDVKGTLYGTTEYGGAHGWGTVFSLKP